ncbi:MAG: MFS transporter [Xenophilus sp.]
MLVSSRSPTHYQRDLAIYLGARFISEAAALALSVAIGWMVYRLSNAPLALGIVGLVQFVPMFLLALPAGELCDRVSARRVMAAGLAIQCLCAVAFLLLSNTPSPPLWMFFTVLLMLGAARAFADPASQALLPFLVPPERLSHAIALGSSAWQLAVIAGPILGGWAFGASPAAAYGLCGSGFFLAALGVAALGGRQAMQDTSATMKERMASVAEGVAFICAQPIVLGAISLDLFSVLFGGATALLPIYARDILHVGPGGLGLLRSAPALGAVLIALVQAHRPPVRHIGLKLFAAVAAFGMATLVFAFSTSFILTLLTLVALGASDMVSVNIRSSLIQHATPDAMRGRVSAVNMLFIGASSELGAFESGAAASLLGTVPAVVFGGVATLLVAGAWMKLFPTLRQADRPGGAVRPMG